MYNAKKIGKVYFPDVEKREDTALWLKILKSGNYASPIKKNLAYYRIHKGSVSSKKINLIKYQWNLYYNYEKLSVFKSIFYIFTIIVVKIFKLKEMRIDSLEEK